MRSWMVPLVVAMAGCRGGGGGGGDDDATATGTSDTGGSTSTGVDTADTTGTDTDGPTPAIPPPGGLRRVLSHQYVASIELLLGPDAAAAAEPPLDPSLGGFDAIAATESSLSPADVEQYERSAKAVAHAAIVHPETLATLVPCVQQGPQDDACYATLARDLGRAMWRRPLTEVEWTPLANLGKYARDWDDGNFESGVEYMLVALLESPRFLYIVEVGEPSDDGGARRLTANELATRMSFFLLGRTPDLELLDLAEGGELGTDEQIRVAAYDLLGQPRARDTVTRFYAEFLSTRDLPTKGKSADLFPSFTPSLAQAMIEETDRLVEQIVFDEDGNALDLYDASSTWVNDELATLYGVAAPPDGEWMQVELPGDQHRAGVLTQAGWLTMMSHGELNSPSRRGLFVQEQVLCNDIPPVPPDVNPMLTPPPPGMSLRQWLETLHENNGDSCKGCHQLFDPIGFAFENYDPIGAYRTVDNGVLVDSSGTIAGVGEWASAEELVGLVRADPRASRCLVKQVWVDALGFSDTTDQAPALDDLDDAFAASQYNLKGLLVELVASDVFRRVDEPK